MRSYGHQHSLLLSVLLAGARITVIAVSGLMVLITLAQVIFRYVISAPLPWSEELARYCFVWIVFLGGAIGLARGFHLGVDLFVNALPERLQRWLDLLVSILIACFAASVIHASLPVLQLNMFQRSPAMGVQMTWIYIAIPVSMALIVLICVERIVGQLRQAGAQGASS